MYNKKIELLLAEYDTMFAIEYDANDEMVTFTLNDFMVDEENSKPYNTVLKVGDKVEVYFSIDELKELVKTIQSIIPTEKTNK